MIGLKGAWTALFIYEPMQKFQNILGILHQQCKYLSKDLSYISQKRSF